MIFELAPEGVMAAVVWRTFLDGSHSFTHSKTRRAVRLVYSWGGEGPGQEHREAGACWGG